jgi:hypothetical protein
MSALKRADSYHLHSKKTQEVLRNLIDDANQWTVHTWGTRQYVKGLQGACRAVFTRGTQKFSCLDGAPYICARLGTEAGVRDRGIAQFNSVPRSSHREVTNELYEEEGVYRQLMDEMPDDFTVPPILEERLLPKN